MGFGPSERVGGMCREEPRDALLQYLAAARDIIAAHDGQFGVCMAAGH